MTVDRLPVYFVSHGGGPWPWIPEMDRMFTSLRASLEAMPGELGATPSAILCVTAHWEGPAFTVQTNPQPDMYYDYGGFPEHTYRVQYPAPGSPEVAARVVELLGAANLPVAEDPKRGFDHGTFVPLAVAWPDANIPVVQLSLHRSFDPMLHIDLGRALAPLRDEGVFIVGSGLSFHNLRVFQSTSAIEPSRQFDAWLADTMMHSTPEERVSRLVDWERAPSARVCHPREEHLLPLMVAVGAAESDEASQVYHDTSFGGLIATSYRLAAA